MCLDGEFTEHWLVLCVAVARFPWDHPHLEPLEGEDYSLPEGCVQYFIAGQSVALTVSCAHYYHDCLVLQ